MNDVKKPSDLAQRVDAEIADSFDEELEMEIDDERLARVLQGLSENPEAETLNRHVYFEELFRLQRELVKLQRSLGGIKELSALPDALFIIDVGYQKGAVAEAVKLGIPVIGVVDTNHSPDGISYIIPGNDDSSRAIRLYARGMADAVLEGRTQAVEEVAAASRDEFVEVEDEDEDKE